MLYPSFDNCFTKYVLITLKNWGSNHRFITNNVSGGGCWPPQEPRTVDSAGEAGGKWRKSWLPLQRFHSAATAAAAHTLHCSPTTVFGFSRPWRGRTPKRCEVADCSIPPHAAQYCCAQSERTPPPTPSPPLFWQIFSEKSSFVFQRSNAICLRLGSLESKNHICAQLFCCVALSVR